MMWLRNMVDAGWSAKEQALGGALRSWLPRGGDACPSRMVSVPLRQHEYVIMAPFLPKNEVLEELKQLGSKGYVVVYDEQQLAAARHLARYLPISQILGPGALSAAHSDCASLGRFPAGYRVGVHALHGSAGQGVALVHRSVRRTTLVLSHVVRARKGGLWEPTRRAQRSPGFDLEQLGNHLLELGRGRGAVTAVFDGHRVWDIATSEWVERCQRSGALQREERASLEEINP